MSKKSAWQVIQDRRIERETRRRLRQQERERQEQLERERRQQTIADVHKNAGSLREWRARAHREAAAADAKSRLENQQSGRQTERSPHLALGPAGAAVDSRAGAERRRKEQQEEDRKRGIVRGRPPWA